MAKPILLIATLPFPGFYCSEYSEALDHEETMWCEYKADEAGHECDDNERRWPEALRLTSGDLAELFIHSSDYRVGELRVAQWYASAFDYLLGERMGLSVRDTRQRYDYDAKQFRKEVYQRPSARLQFESMSSPREYNFSTDRIFAYVPLSVAKTMLRRCKAENYSTLCEVINERFTSRSGFISFYRTDLDAWLSKPLRDWDWNELGSLIIATLRMTGGDTDSPVTRDEIHEYTFGDNGAYEAWESCVDWAKFERKRLQVRAEKLAEWIEADRDEFKRWFHANRAEAAEIMAAEPDFFFAIDIETIAALPYRCPMTPDLFGGTAFAREAR